MGLTAASSRRPCATSCASQDCCCQCPCPSSRPLPTHASAADSQTLRQVWLSLLRGSLLLSPGSCCAHGFVCVFQKSLVSLGFDFNLIAAPLPSRCDFFVLGPGVSFFGGFQHPPVDDCSAIMVILVFSQEKMRAHS